MEMRLEKAKNGYIVKDNDYEPWVFLTLGEAIFFLDNSFSELDEKTVIIDAR